jgi:hypothetical protein
MAAKTGTYTKIATTTLGSNASSVAFSSIDSNYTDLILVMSYRSTRASTYSYPNIRFNSDTGTNYSNTYLYGDGVSAASSRNINQTAFSIYEAVGNSATSSIFAHLTININDYSNSNTYKNILVRGGSTPSGNIVCGQVGLWRSTSAISNILIYDGNSGSDILSGSSFMLYGIEAGNI